jgi:ribose 5-phosphate isomerase A
MDQAKINVATAAVELVKEGMLVGLGSGSTASYAIEALGMKVRQGLNVRAVAASVTSETLARLNGINIIELSEDDVIDLAIDGADEVDTTGNLIKGGGGSLLREKILAYCSKRFHVMVDESKVVDRLGRFPLPVEIVPFSSTLTLKMLRDVPCEPVVRQRDGRPFITDNGNLIADCKFDLIEDPSSLDVKLKMIPGVVETGLFWASFVTSIFVGYRNGSVKEISVSE